MANIFQRRNAIFQRIKGNISQSESEMKPRYILHPVTGRSIVDYALDALCLTGVVAMWVPMFHLRNSEWDVELVIVRTLVTIGVIASLIIACENTISVKSCWNPRTKLSLADKRQYATLKRFRAFEGTVFGVVLPFTSPSELDICIIAVCCFGALFELCFALWRLKSGKPFLP